MNQKGNTLENKDRQIMAQTAGKIAGELIVNDDRLTFEHFATVLGVVNDAIVEASGSDAVAVTAPAPVTTAPPPTTTDVQQAVENLQAGGVPVKAVPGPSSSDDEWWQYFVNNRNEFWDNRDRDNVTIKGGNSPDFRAKNLTDKSGGAKGMFLVSRRFGTTAPDYVFEALGIPKPTVESGTQGQAAVVSAPAGAPQSAPF